MLLYDITNLRTLFNLSAWVESIRGNAGNIPIILVGVKLDLEEYRLITHEEGRQLARYFNLSKFTEISIKTGKNVEEAFNLLVEAMFERYAKDPIEENTSSGNPELEDLLNEILVRAPRHPSNNEITEFNLSQFQWNNYTLQSRTEPQAVFKINPFLTVKLEYNRTNIYVNNRLIRQCKYLLLNLSTNNIRKYDAIDSIDEAVEFLDKSLELGNKKHTIDPETEFWGHCSNLQAWYENKYDTRILHRNIAFPLLRALFNAGDPLAKSVLKEEIAQRLASGHLSVFLYLIEKYYLQFLTDEELRTIIENPKVIKQISHWYSNRNVPPAVKERIKKILNKLSCPHCTADTSSKIVDKLLAGIRVKCPHCGTELWN